MAIRSYFVLGVLIAAATSGCAGMSGQRFYDEQDKRARGLDEIVDCPSCPSRQGGHDGIIQAASNDEVIPPHSKFHPVPTRPVFSPKVAPATATLAINDSPAPQPAEKPEPATLADSSDAPPAPPALRTASAKPAARSVLVKSPAAATKTSPEESLTSVLNRPKLAEPRLVAPATIEYTDATPLPIAATPKLITADTPTPAARVTTTSDGWRPRVAN